MSTRPRGRSSTRGRRQWIRLSIGGGARLGVPGVDDVEEMGGIEVHVLPVGDAELRLLFLHDKAAVGGHALDKFREAEVIGHWDAKDGQGGL
jgi:hypothetical protein